jgi:hypothetical protein
LPYGDPHLLQACLAPYLDGDMEDESAASMAAAIAAV